MAIHKPTGHHFIIPVSDTQEFRQFGTAVVPECVKTVAIHMAPLPETPETSARHGRQVHTF